MMIVSPDEGALDRNIYYATVMGLEMGMFYKRRDYTQVINGRNPIVAHEYLGASVEGKDVFVADDIIASGDSMIEVAKHLKERNARRVFVAGTFGLFTGGLEVFQKAYEEGIIDNVLTTNLNYRNPALADKPWYVEVDMSKYISYIIASLNYDRSISRLLNPLNRIQNLLTRFRNAQ
jgi:ribose-phosphate pyrophosphokinase